MSPLYVVLSTLSHPVQCPHCTSDERHTGGASSDVQPAACPRPFRACRFSVSGLRVGGLACKALNPEGLVDYGFGLRFMVRCFHGRFLLALAILKGVGRSQVLRV